MKNYEKYSCSWSKRPFFRYLFATGPRHHVTICYLKRGQSPPQENEPFFEPFSGTKRQVTSWTNPRMPTTFFTPLFRPFCFISIGYIIIIIIMISKSSLIGLGAFGTSCVGLYLFEVLQSNLHISKKK
jgi:hypothetical protein